MVTTGVDGSKRTVLIVDDSPMSVELMVHMVTMHGYEAESATSGEQALDLVRSSPPDLILLDIMMPGIDGFEVAERLRADERARDIPIIFISALSDQKSKVRALRSGGVDYVSKPLYVDEVIARVNTHIRLRDVQQRLERQLAEREELIAELDALNEQLKDEIVEREAAQEAREASLKMMRQALDRTEGLYRITRSLITSEGIEDMLEAVTASVAKALPADRVITVTLDLEAEEISFLAKAGPGVTSAADPSFAELMDGLTGWVVKGVQPVISPSGHPDPRESVNARRRREEAGCGAILVVPLYYQGVMMGTMTAINRPDERDFDHQDLAQLSAIAGQLSIALANARLSAETAYLKEFNEGIVQGVAEAILLTDNEQRITFANPAAVSMLGYESETLLGRPCAALFSEGEASTFADAMLAYQSGVARRFETTLRSCDDQPVPVLASIRPLYQEGALTGHLIAFTDITEIKQAEEQLRRYAADLEAQNAELDAFAHTVAHDLRSPLTGMIGFVDLIRRAAKELGAENILEYAHYLDRNSIRMNNIIEELLLLASVREMGQVPLRPVDMARIVREVQGRLDYLIEEYEAQISVADAWPVVVGYGPWIEEVWVNYLSNALKYGGRPEEGVAPEIALGWDRVDGEETIRFWVRDNGQGLRPEERAQLFTPFERLHNVRAEGHGLGLSIVRRILEKLGGEVGVESGPGEGSRFYFTLPRA
ncbi:MAG: response regulator [Anaerolineae bacterium]